MYVQCSDVAVDVVEDDVTSYDHRLLISSICSICSQKSIIADLV